MFMHNKRLQYTVHVGETNPVLAKMMLEQFGGADGELAAAMRYFTQALAEDDPGRKDMLMDIATEELSHLEVIGSIVAMLNKGLKGRLAEGNLSEAEMFVSLNSGGASAKEALLYGGGPALADSAGVPFTGAYVDSRGDAVVDLRSNIAAESRAKIVYERLINCTEDPGVKEALGFLMTGRSLTRSRSKKPSTPSSPTSRSVSCRACRSTLTSTSTPLRARVTWRGRGIAARSGRSRTTSWGRLPLDGGDGLATVVASPAEKKDLKALAARTRSNPASDPETGADLGAGPGAGTMTMGRKSRR